MNSGEVYLVEHVHEFEDGSEDVKMIGVYSDEGKAGEAVARAKLLPGFAKAPDSFRVSRYRLDTDHWLEGYVTVE